MNHGLVGFSDPSPSPLVDYDLGALQLLKRRKAVNPEDDHFDSQILDPKWIKYGSPTINLINLPGWIGISHGTGILQPIPAGDWSIETELMVDHPGAAGYDNGGLSLLTSSNPAANTSNNWNFGCRNSLISYRLMNQNYVNNVYNAENESVNFTAISPLRIGLMINKTGTTYTFYYSLQPGTNLWNRGWTTSALGFTPTFFGLIQYNTTFYYNYFLRY